MSYDLTIRSDASFKNVVAIRSIRSFLGSLPNVVESGAHFALDDPPSRRMDIYLDFANEDGDSTEEPLDDDGNINRLCLCIPYAHLKSATLNRDYLPIALQIAKHLGWELYDEQSGEPY